MTRTLPLLFAWVPVASVAACGGSQPPPQGSGSKPVATAVSPEGEAPPHRFEPRQHPPRVHRAPPPPPALGSLPALVDNSARCFDFPRRDRRPPPWRRGGRGVRGGGGFAGPPSGAVARKPRPKPKKGSSGLSDMAAAGAGVSGGVSSGAGAPAPAAPPPPPAEPAAEAAAPATRPRGADRDDSARGEAKVAAQPAQPPAQVAESPDDRFQDWGQATYLSNDDTMSLSSAQRVIYAIDKFLPLPPEHIRPHEILNYFSFSTAPVAPTNDFSIDASIAAKRNEPGIYSLALAIRGRPLALQTRRNANIAFVIDRSGSMSAEGRMEYLKRGLLRALDQTKRGDVLHYVLFDDNVCVPIKNFVVGRDSRPALERLIRRFRPRGSTNLHAGLNEGYAVADRAYRPTYTNRVVMITDAIANTGVTDHEMISTISKFYDSRRIRLSGVGVGRDFNDGLLDRLTERGRGAYVFLGSQAEVDAVFGRRFISLIETSAVDVHFRLHLPPSLRMNVFYGEEASTVKEDVQAIHYFANTSQLFLSDLMARRGKLRPQDDIMLTIEYEHPETGADMVEEYAFRLGEIQRESRNVKKGQLVMAFIDGLAAMADRPRPSRRGRRERGWEDDGAWQECEVGRTELRKMSEGISGDPEVTRALGLWDKYCARYDRPRRAVEPPPDDRWPGASGGR